MSLWVISVISNVLADVRFTPESDRFGASRKVTLCAISDQSAVQQKTYSITSSARDSSDCGTDRQSAFTVFKLMTSSILLRKMLMPR